MKIIIVVLALAACCFGQTAKDDSPHTAGFAKVNGVKLHYLDWGGKGDAVLFITGMGNSAHVFDEMAPQFADRYRVLALTRRGYGESDKPLTGYDADTLADDVRHFLDHMKIKRAHLIGHSAAGNELSSFGARFPKRTLSLVYLDAAYDRREVTEIEKQDPLPEEPRKLDPISEKIDAALIRAMATYDPPYRKIKAPVLNYYALFEQHWSVQPDTPESTKKLAEAFMATVVRPYQRRNIDRFRREVPRSRVIELAGTHHYFFRDPAIKDEVVRTIREFLNAR